MGVVVMTLSREQFETQLRYGRENAALTAGHVDEVFWITFGGQVFAGLTFDQWNTLWTVATTALGYNAIQWGSAPQHLPADHPFNVPVHAEDAHRANVWDEAHALNAEFDLARLAADCICDLSVQSVHMCEPLYGTTF
jgi:hypothetical protein